MLLQNKHMGLEGFENTGNSEQKESLNLGLSSLNDTQSIIKNQARNYVLREQKYGIDSSSSITDINSLLEHQQSENESLEKQVQLETREFLDKEILINEAKTTIYEMLGINNNQELNSSYENFTKGFVDELVIGNYKMAIEVINTKGTIIIEALKQLIKWEVIKQMAVALGESVVDLFSGNSYEKGKSVAELGLITIGAGVGAIIGKKGLKYGMKKYAKNRINKENLVSSPDLKDVIGGVNKQVDNIVPKKQLDFEKIMVDDIAKLGDKDRLEVGSSLLKRKLTPKQEKAILEAHNIGDSGIGEYSIPELKQKVEVLKEANFDSDEIRTLLEKGVCGKDKTLKLLDKGQDLLGEKLTLDDIVGEGDNAIIFSHPNMGDRVVKIAKDGDSIDKIDIEYNNHKIFYDILEEGRIEHKGLIPENVKIPLVEKLPGKDGGYFIMERIEGQSLKTKFYIEHFSNDFEKLGYNREYLDSLTDSGLKTLMENNSIYGIPDHILSGDVYSKLLTIKMKNFYNNHVYGTELGNTLNFLESKGCIHKDLHPGNIMIDNKGNYYIIDFGKAKVPKIN